MNHSCIYTYLCILYQLSTLDKETNKLSANSSWRGRSSGSTFTISFQFILAGILNSLIMLYFCMGSDSLLLLIRIHPPSPATSGGFLPSAFAKPPRSYARRLPSAVSTWQWTLNLIHEVFFTKKIQPESDQASRFDCRFTGNTGREKHYVRFPPGGRWWTQTRRLRRGCIYKDEGRV